MIKMMQVTNNDIGSGVSSFLLESHEMRIHDPLTINHWSLCPASELVVFLRFCRPEDI